MEIYRTADKNGSVFAPDWCDGNKLQVEWEKDSSIQGVPGGMDKTSGECSLC